MRTQIMHCGLILVVMLGCHELGDITPADGPAEKSSTPTHRLDDVYPVDPQVQWEHQFSGDASPKILNAVAYARYAVDLLGDIENAHSESAHTIAMSLARTASQSGIPGRSTLNYAGIEATEFEYQEYREEIYRDAQSQTPDRPLSRQAKSVVDGRRQLSVCMADGFTDQQCCQALAWAASFKGKLESDAHPDYEASTLAILGAQQDDLDRGERASLQPFNQSSIRAWLSYCGGVINDAPNDIQSFKRRFGNYSTGQNWVREMHPISPAKQAGRRIFRTVLEDGTWVSVAESTSDECFVRETETIVRQPGRQAVFWVFDGHGHRVEHAYFPTRRPEEDAIRFAPNSCMGCHYTMDTRRFDVATPSFEALNLQLFETPGGTVWRDHSHCAQNDDSIIYHQVPIAGQ